MKKNILKAIGNTPLVRINNFNIDNNVTLAMKLEGNNPGGSVKDRIALYMIEAAEKRGELRPDKIILEPTSGNTGIGLAMVACFKGYKATITMPENMSIERKRIMEAFGAEVILTAADQGTDGAITKAREMFRENQELYYMPDQFNNKDNILAHYETTAPEIWEQTKGQITHFVAGMGTTGTLMGTSQRLKEFNSSIKIIAVEPHHNHKIQGLKNMQEAIVPGIYNPDNLDQIIKIKDEDAFYMTNQLIKKEGIFAGLSTGAALHVSLTLARSLKDAFIVVISPDRGDKYVSSGLYCGEQCSNRSKHCHYHQNE